MSYRRFVRWQKADKMSADASLCKAVTKSDDGFFRANCDQMST